MNKTTKNRGFASMDREKQREIARKGGIAVSQDREHMSKIGAMGGRKPRPEGIEEPLINQEDEQSRIHQESTGEL